MDALELRLLQMIIVSIVPMSVQAPVLYLAAYLSYHTRNSKHPLVFDHLEQHVRSNRNIYVNEIPGFNTRISKSWISGKRVSRSCSNSLFLMYRLVTFWSGMSVVSYGHMKQEPGCGIFYPRFLRCWIRFKSLPECTSLPATSPPAESDHPSCGEKKQTKMRDRQDIRWATIHALPG
ncbi:uncharacterized protein BDV14DRAFT_149999 [Aspergillus stella-maris]|uniref:uncharacterized protein n=1 Tax=Aspergillus stella-maris TaxID=1810926 RepID=UPI003CCDE3EB